MKKQKVKQQEAPNSFTKVLRACRNHKWRTFFGIIAVLVLSYCIASWVWQYGDSRKAFMTTKGPFQANIASLNSHKMPAWWQDAKFGIMVHWGLYSVPGYAPKGDFVDILKKKYDTAMVSSPYAEDYANAIKDPDSPTAKWHKEHYGNMPYEGFKKQFEDGLKNWNADTWAKAFHNSGAKYVVVTAKYADGYTLWPSSVKNPHQKDWYSKRDLIGEMATAVRKQGMKFGVYYSGGVDYTFQQQPIKTMADYGYLHYGADYATYADAQVRELITRYKPDILWDDISWPTGQQRLNALLADYYNTVPDGVVNDRWHVGSFSHQIMNLKPFRMIMDSIIKLALTTPEGAQSIEQQRPSPHNDFTTSEYVQYDTIQSKPWENDRGMGNSFGYNRQESENDYASFDTSLLPSLASAIAKNGNFLLNVGPKGGAGTIVPEQQSRLDKFGVWLQKNGEAVYGTRPNKQYKAMTTNNQEVYLTTKSKTTYLIVTGSHSGTNLTIKDSPVLKGTARLLGDNSPVAMRQTGKEVTFTFSQPLNAQLLPVIQIQP